MIRGSMIDRSNIYIYTIYKQMSDTEALGIVEMRDKQILTMTKQNIANTFTVSYLA